MRLFNSIYEQLLLLTLFFVITEIAMSMHIVAFLTPYKITLGLLALLIFARMLKEGIPFIKSFFKTILTCLNKIRLVAIPVGLYLIFDLVSLKYTAYPRFALIKYITIVSMIAIFCCTSYYMVEVYPKLSRSLKVNRILFTLGMTAIATVVYSFSYQIIYGHTFFTRRLSMVEDYNQFSTVILIGLFCFLLYLHRELYFTKKWYIWRVVSVSICTCAITFSASRRSFLLMIACLVVVAIYEMFNVILKKRDFKKFMSLILSYALIGIIFFSVTTIYNTVTTKRTEKWTKGNEDIINIIGMRSVDEIITDEKALEKREVIWRVAIDDLKSFSTTEKLIGKGASYMSDVYDKPEIKDKFERLYWKEFSRHYMSPHNFILVDLLNGGIVKTGLMITSLISALILLFKGIKKQFTEMLYTTLIALIAIGNLFVSSDHGYLNDKFLWTALILVMVFLLEREKMTESTS